MAKVYSGSYSLLREHGDRIEPERIVGHEVEIFSYLNLFWHPRGEDYVVAGGLLKPVTRFDLGNLVADFFLSALPPKGFSYAQGKATFPGKKSKARPYFLPQELREFEQFADVALLHDRERLLYQFELKSECIYVEDPLEFKVNKYFSESYDPDEETITRDTTDRIVPWFKRLNKNNAPDPHDISLMVFPEVTDLKWN